MKDADLKDTLTRMAAAARGINDDAHRAADQAHRERIHAQIGDDIENLGGSIDGLVEAIAAGRIRHLTINY